MHILIKFFDMPLYDCDSIKLISRFINNALNAVTIPWGLTSSLFRLLSLSLSWLSFQAKAQ